jgi:hypothetical protein
MTCIVCSVIPVEDGWTVERDNVRLGLYQSDDLALRAAVTKGLQLREQEQPARVSVRDRGGNVCAEYCLCKDFKMAII